MGMCGPTNPCEKCVPMYQRDPRYVPDPDRPGSFVIAHDADRRKRRRRASTHPVASLDRVPIVTGSKRSDRARRRAKHHRMS